MSELPSQISLWKIAKWLGTPDYRSISSRTKSRKEIGDYFERKAKSDLEERGYSVHDANAIRRNNKAYDCIIECSNASRVLISVKSRTTQKEWSIANGKIKRGPDGSYQGVEKIEEKLLPGGFTIIYLDLKEKGNKQGIETVYVIPHDAIKPYLPRWVERRTGGEHTFTINPTSAKEIDLDMERYEKAWHLLPPP